jgi:anti-sigma B factor antagonist
MKFSEERTEGVLVLRLNGQLMGGPDAEALRERILGAIRDGITRILLDMQEVTWINSSGLGVLISSHMAARQKSGGSLKLMRVTKRIESILNVTRLSTIFEIYATEEDAWRSLEASPAGGR